ncbi:thiolase family protein [Aurantiacibacter gangjinensis]|uniref:Acetyl-CoA acetyltransferase n=1 Tax=Aurantiacibacter gangjinensis TaxID=502682 RepID=A0A0G9MTP1_9SPHN|nr:thiolase family protein [Aurantiacibacter gangjinensis]APE28422.1 3-ketoacyl-CoA thiolase, Acetyl-CoA acetyltransferase [Aurantiacibacter gangjinensis]KLE32643.1 acetyl-CoA acetyltransferase [Aurantiacibacter gangjinensis]
MTDVVIAGYVRSPFHPAYKGALAKTRPDDLAANTIRGLVEKTGVKPEDIEDIVMGCAFPEGEQGFNIARLVGLLADLPLDVGGITMNRFCGSSMSSIHYAAGQIAMGAGDVFICAGVEGMSRVPMTGFNPMPNPELAKKSAAYLGMGDTAENVAKKYEISREEQEAFAVKSQQKAGKALENNAFDDEIVPFTLPDGTVVDKDGTPRPSTTAEDLAGLKLAFDQNGTVTAGTSSPLTDGAVAVLVCSADYAAANGLKVMAKIKSMAISGCAPEIMGIGPVGASQKALERAGLTIDDIDIVELNEAFSSQSIATIRDLGVDEAKLNLDGGAIAIGHPLGATGARIVGKAASLLQREGKKYSLSTQCIGGGQGIATILEAV